MEAKYAPPSMVQIKDIRSGKLTGREVELKGWIYRTRTVGGKVFVVLRDSTGILQVAITKGDVPPDQFEAIQKALIESAVIVRGTVVQDKRAPGGYEIRAKDLHIVRVRHAVFGAVHGYFRGQGFWEVHPPMITPAGSEGGATLFEMDYFGHKAYLTQSWQLYAEALALAMEKVYYIGPSFRAEKSRTTRHLTEYWHAEMEEAWIGMEEAIKHAEGVISHACARVAEERPEEAITFGRTPEFLKAVTAPFEHMRYDDALKLLKAK